MKVRRGDIVLAFYPFSTGVATKKRPVLVLQNDRDNQRLSNTIVAQITSNPPHLVARAEDCLKAALGLP